MRRMTQAEYDRLTEGATVLARDAHGDKVLRLADGRGLKLFRRKNVVSSNILWPYARRFGHAAAELARRGVATVTVEDVFRIPTLGRDAVIYHYLEGVTLRDALAGGDVEKLMDGFARFLAELHEKGVYFRGIHFGNVLVLAGGGWGLIDVSEARFRRGPLGLRLRARNFKPLLRYAQDAGALATFGLDRFVGRYAAAAGLPSTATDRLRSRLTATAARDEDGVATG